MVSLEYTLESSLKLLAYNTLGRSFKSALESGLEFHLNKEGDTFLCTVDSKSITRREGLNSYPYLEGRDVFAFADITAKANSIELDGKSFLEILKDFVNLEVDSIIFNRDLFSEKGDNEYLIYSQEGNRLTPLTKVLCNIPSFIEKYKNLFKGTSVYEENECGIGLKIDKEKIGLIESYVRENSPLVGLDPLLFIASSVILSEYCDNLELLLPDKITRHKIQSGIFYDRLDYPSGSGSFLSVFATIVRDNPEVSKEQLEEFSEIFKNYSEPFLKNSSSFLATAYTDEVLRAWGEYKTLADTLDQAMCVEKDLRKQAMKRIEMNFNF